MGKQIRSRRRAKRGISSLKPGDVIYWNDRSTGYPSVLWKIRDFIKDKADRLHCRVSLFAKRKDSWVGAGIGMNHSFLMKEIFEKKARKASKKLQMEDCWYKGKKIPAYIPPAQYVTFSFTGNGTTTV